MTDATIPPCGPERDRLVAEAVGWEWAVRWEDAWDAEADKSRYPSTSDADALAALEAWRLVGCRGVVIQSPVDLRDDDGYGPYCAEWEVTLDYRGGSLVTVSVAPTLADAATAALVRWRNERSAT